MNMLFFEVQARSFWTYLTSGSPSMFTLLCVVNAVFLALFMFCRGYYNPLNYASSVRRKLQLTMLIANTLTIFQEPLLPILQHWIWRFQGLIDIFI
jgi:hypothetical protein